MSYHSECHGRVRLGELPARVRERLAGLPGEWLEYDPTSSSIIVRHIEPTESPVLETVASELIQVLAEVPFELHDGIEGGVFFVHREEAGQLVRLRVDSGGALHVQWAHPEYAGSAKRPYSGRQDIAIDSWEQRLNGTASFGTGSPETASKRLLDLADTFEGLYPEGDLTLSETGDGVAELVLRDVNLDAALLVDQLLDLAEARTLDGGIEVTSFGETAPENHLRFTFDAGKVWIQHPLLWTDSPNGV